MSLTTSRRRPGAGSPNRARAARNPVAIRFSPAGALEAYEREEILLVFPTIKTLEQLAPFSSADELLGWATGREVVPIEPRVVMEGEVARVVLPGEPGYEA